MSLTSCYRYVLELPVNTLNRMLVAALREADGAGMVVTKTWTGVPVNGHTATVEVRPDDLDAHPPALTLTAVDLEASLHMRMRVGVTLEDLPDLDQVVYFVDFDLPGRFESEVVDGLRRLVLAFPAVTEPALNLVVDGGQVVLTPGLVEARIHAAYDADPTLGHNVQVNVPWPPGPDPTVLVTTDIYDDDPMSAGFRGAITVTITNPAELVIHMPGHFKVQGLDSTYINTDMTIDVKVAVVQTDGELRVRLGAVTSNAVTVTFATPPTNPIYDTGAKAVLRNAIASKVSQMGPPPDHDIVQAIPTSAQVRELLADRLIETAGLLRMPVFTPQPPAADEIDLTTFVETTVAQQALALQLVPLADGTPCDAPDLFAEADGFAVAIARPEVDKMLQPIVDGAKGDRHIEGYDITVNSLSATPHDPDEHDAARGHIWIDGTAEVHVDCWPDPDVDFSGPIYLVPKMDADGKIAFTADAGQFGADDPCCADVDPAKIAALIEGEQSAPVALPKNFSGVGELTLGVTRADIFAAAIVIQGTLDVVTTHKLQEARLRRGGFWAAEPAAGG